jgi:hypothetical protein
VLGRRADDLAAVQAADVPGAMAASSFDVPGTCIFKWNMQTVALNIPQTFMLSFFLIHECNLVKKTYINKT